MKRLSAGMHTGRAALVLLCGCSSSSATGAASDAGADGAITYDQALLAVEISDTVLIKPCEYVFTGCGGALECNSGAPGLPNAGTVEVSAGGIVYAQLDFDGDGGYMATGDAGGTIPAGASLDVHGSGGPDVPAFDLTFTVPSAAPSLVQPADGTTISAGSALTVTWMPGVAATAQVSVEGIGAGLDGQGASIACFAPMTAGSETLSSGQLAPILGGVTEASVCLTGATQLRQTAGTAVVSVAAFAPGPHCDGVTVQ
jgi:hypothetical protein